MWFIVWTACVTTTPEPVSVEASPAAPAAEDASSAEALTTPSPPAEVKAPGNLPVMTEAELIEAAEAEAACVTQCVQENQMRSVSPQEIRIDCERECNEAHFTGQVEVIPEADPVLDSEQ